MSDILDGLAQVRATFYRAGLEPPTTILLASNEEGIRFLMAVRQQPKLIAVAGSPDLGKPVEMADGSVWMECQVFGIKVRWPANRFAMPDGSWCFV